VHRDLKPANVLLRPGPDGERALLTDFGLARDVESEVTRVTRTGQFEGTPGYWAPEQAKGEVQAMGPATDVYGLGALLFACLTGRPPIEAASLQEYVYIALNQVAPSPRRLRPEVPEWLDALCRRCLAREPEERPPSAEEVARALATPPAAPAPAAGWGRLLALSTGGAVFALSLLAAALIESPSSGMEPSPPPLAPPSATEPSAPPTATVEAAPPEPRSATDVAMLRGLVTAARNLQGEGRHEAAASAWETVLAIVPGDGEAHAERGSCYQALRRYDEALEDYDQALRLGVKHSELYLQRGRTLRFMKRYEEALADLQRALDLSSGSAAVLYERGLCYLDMQRHDDALRELDRVLTLVPEFKAAHYLRARCKHALGRSADALADLEVALARRPDAPYAHALQARIYASQGRDGDAIAAYTRALGFRPGSSTRRELLLERADLYLAGGDPRTAQRDLSRLLADDPDNAALLARRGEALAGLGRHAEALADYDRALELGLPAERAEEVRALRAAAAAKAVE